MTLSLLRSDIQALEPGQRKLKKLEAKMPKCIAKVLGLADTSRRRSSSSSGTGVSLFWAEDAEAAEVQKIIGYLAKYLACASHSKVLKQRARDILSTEAFANNLGMLTLPSSFTAYDELMDLMDDRLDECGALLGKLTAVYDLVQSVGCVQLRSPALSSASSDDVSEHPLVAGLSADGVHQGLCLDGVLALLDFSKPGQRQFEEEVAAHLLHLVALGIDDEYQVAVDRALADGDASGTSYTLHRAPPKTFMRMLNKALSTEDYREKVSPRSRFNCDVVRLMLGCRSVQDMKCIVATLARKFGGCAKFKNLFALDEEERDGRYNLLSVMLTVPFRSAATYQGMCANGAVQEKWTTYRSAVLSNMARERWEAGVDRARSLLQHPGIGGETVSMLCEVQVLFNAFIEVRALMHEPYKAKRTGTEGELYQDFLLSNPSYPRTNLQPFGANNTYDACCSGQVSVLRSLLKPGDNVNVDTSGRELLYFACLHARDDAARYLLNERGADPNHVRSDDNNPSCLFAAASVGSLDCVHLLLSSRADPNKAKTTGHTPLLIAAHEGFKDVANMLLDQGALVNQGKENGATPLYHAAQRGLAGMVALLLSRGAGPNLAKTDGTTPLYIAAESGHTAVVEALLGHGASVEQATIEPPANRTPLCTASSQGQ